MERRLNVYFGNDFKIKKLTQTFGVRWTERRTRCQPQILVTAIFYA